MHIPPVQNLVKIKDNSRQSIGRDTCKKGLERAEIIVKEQTRKDTAETRLREEYRRLQDERNHEEESERVVKEHISKQERDEAVRELTRHQISAEVRQEQQEEERRARSTKADTIRFHLSETMKAKEFEGAQDAIFREIVANLPIDAKETPARTYQSPGGRESVPSQTCTSLD
ncbi:hypothetical protein K504DRAFT_486326 [Pleomassaria siparia CBS 279.74]|uniref:Uncharacterized protein n=1 Tax=Pleomassaria siparia CBS 279.74 TaxID=1314801 RepID=A0A6G1KPJ9_9PLEO|nr:hypothetical protein K504DRAFT_486326 [Pleomassaria siparia CBS 279.74]